MYPVKINWPEVLVKLENEKDELEARIKEFDGKASDSRKLSFWKEAALIRQHKLKVLKAAIKKANALIKE